MSYPSTLDSLPEDQTNATVQRDNHPELHNDLSAAVNALQETLGRNPQDTYDDVADRLDTFEEAIDEGLGLPVDELVLFDRPQTAITAGRTAGNPAVQSKLLILPDGGSTQNAITVQAPDSNWNEAPADATEYGTQQAFILFKEGSGAALSKVLTRIDGHTGAFGTGAGLHIATGLNQHGTDYGEGSPSIFIQRVSDGPGIWMMPASDAPAYPYITCYDLESRVIFQVGNNGLIESYGPLGGGLPGLILGRTPGTAEAALEVMPSDGFVGLPVVAGDLVLAQLVAGKATRILSETATRIHSKLLQVQPTAADYTYTQILSGGAAKWALLQVGRTAGEVQLAVASAADEWATGAVAGDGIVNLIDATKTLRLIGGGIRAHTPTFTLEPTAHANTVLQLLSGNASDFTALSMGRASQAEAVLVIVNGADAWTAGTAAGDAVLILTDAAKQLWLGVGTNANEIRIQDGKLGFFNHAPSSQPSAYTPSNVSSDRSYDANATSIDELADVVGTLIADLQSMGLVG